MRKKLFTLLFAIVAIIVPLFAESGTCGDNLTWNLTDGVLTISGTGAMSSYDWGGAPWYSSRSSITSVIIEEGVTSIGDRAFYYCRSLTSVTIPNSVTSIGENAFAYCNSLDGVYITDLTAWCKIDFGIYSANPLYYAHNLYLNGTLVADLIIPNSVTSIGERAFLDCSSLTSVTIGNSITSIGSSAFSGCTSLTSVTIGNSVTTIGNLAFEYCSGLTSVTIPNSVTSIGSHAFAYCSGLTSVTIPNSVTSIGGSAFSGCTGLTSVTIPNSVTSIGDYAFYHCSGLPIIDNIRYADTYLVEVINKELSTYTIKEGTRFIGNSAFSGCNNMTSFEVPNSVTSIGTNAFSHIPNIVYNGPASGAPWGARCINGYVDGYFVYNNEAKTHLAACFIVASGEIVIPNCVTSIGDWAFFNCSSLTSIETPNSVTSIGNYAFFNCSSLTTVTIPNCITSIEGFTFYNCSSLTSLTIPNSVTSIGYGAFWGCIDLISVTIPNSVTSIRDGAFNDCSGLTSITCENATPPTLSDSIVFGGVDKSIPLYVPYESIDAYKAADQWNEFTNILPIPSSTEPERFIVTFQNYDGTELQSSKVEYGTLPIYTGATPVRPDDEQYTYTFDGWSPAIVAATADATYTAQYLAKDKHEGLDDAAANLGGSAKFLRDGVLYIKRNGKTYTVTGTEVK